MAVFPLAGAPEQAAPTRTFPNNPDPQMTTDENKQSAVDSLWEENEPMARQMYFTYMLSRTPSDLQGLMVEKIGANLPGGLPDGAATITDGDPVAVWGSPSGIVMQGSPGVAVIVDEAVSRVELPFPTTRGMINHGQSIAVRDGVGGPTTPGSPGAAVVVNHAVTQINLVQPADIAYIQNGTPVVMHDETDQVIQGYTATAQVSNKNLTAVKLVPNP
jgi:hypothetical protein